MPARAYTVGDEVRLEIEITTPLNLKTVTAVFR